MRNKLSIIIVTTVASSNSKSSDSSDMPHKPVLRGVLSRSVGRRTRSETQHSPVNATIISTIERNGSGVELRTLDYENSGSNHVLRY